MTSPLSLTLLLSASVVYATGGLFMKRSDGLAHWQPTLVFLTLFATGALLQARGMKDDDLGVAYIFVLGVEAVVTVMLSAFVMREGYTLSRLLAIGVVIAGVAWLRAT